MLKEDDIVKKFARRVYLCKVLSLLSLLSWLRCAAADDLLAQRGQTLGLIQKLIGGMGQWQWWHNVPNHRQHKIQSALETRQGLLPRLRSI
jgi:hypothetical protein